MKELLGRFNVLKTRLVLGLALMGGVMLQGCSTDKSSTDTKTEGVSENAAEAIYVAPGKHDELCSFLSGGFNGQVSVYGIPSDRC